MKQRRQHEKPTSTKKKNICTQKAGEAPLGGKEEEEAKNKREKKTEKIGTCGAISVAIRTTPRTTKENGKWK